MKKWHPFIFVLLASLTACAGTKAPVVMDKRGLLAMKVSKDEVVSLQLERYFPDSIHAKNGWPKSHFLAAVKGVNVCMPFDLRLYVPTQVLLPPVEYKQFVFLWKTLPHRPESVKRVKC